MRKIRQPPPTQGEDRLIPFLASLVADDLSPNTVDGYRRDLLAFRRWYREARGTDLRWEKLGANDLINYRQHLVSVERRRPAFAAHARPHDVCTRAHPFEVAMLEVDAR